MKFIRGNIILFLEANLMNDWIISCSVIDNEENSLEPEDGTLVFEVDDCLLAVSFVDVPVANGEAEHFALGNYIRKV